MTNTPKRTNSPVRGEVWMVEFDPAVGSEIQKSRPAVVVNIPEVGRLPLRVVVPLTDWKPHYARYSWFVYIAPIPENGLTKDSGADTFQIKSLSIQRFDHPIGKLTSEQVENIAAAVAICVGY